MRFRPERIQPPERKNVLFVAQEIEERLVERLKIYQGNVEVEIISPWRLERHIVSYALWAEKTKNPIMFSADQAWAFFESLYQDLNRAINRNELALTIEVSGTSFTEIDLCLRWLENGIRLPIELHTSEETSLTDVYTGDQITHYKQVYRVKISIEK